MKDIFKPFFYPEKNIGWINRSNFFEGWYGKIVLSAEKGISFIFGYGGSQPDEAKSFVYVIDENNEFHEFYYDVSETFIDTNDFNIQLGTNRLTKESISLTISNQHREFQLYETRIWKKELLKPNIMGINHFIPKLPCRHAILIQNGRLMEQATKQLGEIYLEKTWGTSFPKKYIWLYAQNFDGFTIQFAFAKIKYAGVNFITHVGFINLHGNILTISKCEGYTSKVLEKESNLRIVVTSKTKKIEIQLRLDKGHTLPSPKYGKMTGSIVHHKNIDGQILFISDNRTQHFVVKGSCEVEL